MKVPSVGRIVHFISYKRAHLAAIVIKVDATGISLNVFEENGRQSLHKNVPYAHESVNCLESWHWPEHVE